MANPLRGEVAFPPVADVVGFERGGVLVLDFNALCSLEAELAESIEDIGLQALQSPGMMRTVFRIALEEKHGSVDSRSVGKIIQALGAERAAELTMQAFTLSFPEAATAGTADPQAAAKAAGTGNGASASGAKSGAKPTRSGGKPRGSSRKR